VIERVPPPSGDPGSPLQALIIDSWFDNYVGVVMLVRMMEGTLKPKEKIRLMATGATYLCEQVGVFTPKAVSREQLSAGEVGFVIAGIRELKGAKGRRHGDAGRRPPRRRCPASRKSSRRCSPGSIRSNRTSTSRCATR
jgi:GTP-binding protein LepA